MPKTQLDWLSVASLWIGAALMAIKAGELPLAHGAPVWLAADWWSYTPLALITFYLLVVIYISFAVTTLKERTSFSEGNIALPDRPKSKESVDHDRKDRFQLILSLERAMKRAHNVINDTGSETRKRDAERELPATNAAILSAHKFCGIPIPKEHDDPVIDLELKRRLIEKVLPFLSEGHSEEAKKEAERFLARFERPRDDVD